MADAFAAEVFSILNFEDMPDGSVFTDEIPARTWTDQGSARIVSGEMILDGSSDWLQSDSKLDWEFLHDGSEDVTLDFKVYQNGSDSKCFVETGGHLATARGIHGRINTDNSITFLITNGSSNTMLPFTWMVLRLILAQIPDQIAVSSRLILCRLVRLIQHHLTISLGNIKHSGVLKPCAMRATIHQTPRPTTRHYPAPRQ